MTRFFLSNCMVVLTAVTFLSTVGCAFNETWVPHEHVDIAGASRPVDHLVVSGMYYSPRAVSYTQSADIVRIKETVGIDDISARVAASLRERGFDARAAVDVTRKDLEPGEILLRGVLVDSGITKDFAHMLTFLCSFGVLGGFVPSPVFREQGYGLNYRFEAIDHAGNILLDTNGGLAKKWSHTWVWGKTLKNPAGLADLERRILDSLAVSLRATRAASGTNPPLDTILTRRAKCGASCSPEGVL